MRLLPWTIALMACCGRPMVRRSALGQMGSFTRSLDARFRASDASPPRVRNTPLAAARARRPASPPAASPIPASDRAGGHLRAFPRPENP